jgi:hypothetical protein
MDKKEIEEGFKAQLAAVLKDLNENGTKDKDAMFLIGSLAGQLISSAKAKTWQNLKASMSVSGFKATLNSLQEQGQKLEKAGNIKAAYAVQAIGVSLVANTMKDPDTAKGSKLLDALIAQAVIFYNKETIKRNN